MARAELPEPSSDLLFAWLSPIEQKMDRRLHPKTPSLNIPATSPLVTKARSALRRTVRASHVNSMKNSEKKAKSKFNSCYYFKAVVSYFVCYTKLMLSPQKSPHFTILL